MVLIHAAFSVSGVRVEVGSLMSPALDCKQTELEEPVSMWGKASHLSLISASRGEEGSWWRSSSPPQHKSQGFHLRG